MANVAKYVSWSFCGAVLITLLTISQAVGTALGASAEEIYGALAKMPKEKRQQVIVDRAQKEGKLVVYGSSEEDQYKAIINGFNKHYPSIKVDYLRAVSSTIVAKAVMEVNAGRWLWDLSSAGSGYHDIKQAKAAARHYGLVAEDAYPKQFIGIDWFSFEVLPLVIAYNKSMVKSADVPKSYADLLDPKWKGKVAIDANPDSIVTAMIKKWGKERTADWLDKFINANQALLRRGHTAQTQLLTVGEFPVASELYAYRVELMMEKGATIDWVVPTDVAEAELPGYVIAREAPNPHAALLFSQYRTSKEGQNIYSKFGRITVHPESDVKYPRLREFTKKPLLDRLTLISVEDTKLWEDASELIDKYIVPRLKAK
jgi:iron(III) transport system substrate-binding protein